MKASMRCRGFDWRPAVFACLVGCGEAKAVAELDDTSCASGAPDDAFGDHGLRLHPGQWADRGGLDGFFVARFDRVS